MTDHLCDTNVWLALSIDIHSHHTAARQWLDTVEDTDRILFSRATQQSFLRLITTTAVVGPYGFEPLSNADAWATFDGILGDARVLLAPEPEGLDPVWRQFAARPSASPALWMDAYLAAFAVAGGYRLVTADRGFRQFPWLDVVLLG